MSFNTVKIKDVKHKIGQLVKQKRKQQRLSQQDLGDLLDLSRLTIQNLERGNNFTIDTLLKILQHFDLLSELNAFITDQQQTTTTIKSLY